MINGKTVSGILLMAGNSSRFSKSSNKTLEKINNKPIFIYSLEAFNNSQYIDDIFIVIKESEKNVIKNILKTMPFKKKISLVLGGNSRDSSVYNGLISSPSDFVVIHDGARPMIKDEYIKNCLLELENYEGTSIAVKSNNTIKITNNEGIVINTTKRSNTWIVQTPQCFQRDLLINAHKNKTNAIDITDDCMLLENMGYKIKLIPR